MGCSLTVDAQRWLTVRILDGITHYPLAGVSLTSLPDSSDSHSSADGVALLKLGKTAQSVRVDYPGFQSVLISSFYSGAVDLSAKLFLFPFQTSPLGRRNDSIPETDRVLPVAWGEVMESHISGSFYVFPRPDGLERPFIQPGTDQSLSTVLGKLNGVIVLNDPADFSLQRLLIGGISGRYNQLEIDQVVIPSSNLKTRAYDLNTWPIETVETATVLKERDAPSQGDFSGGGIQITTPDAPVRDFISVKATGIWSGNSTGKYFATDKKTWVEKLGFLSRSHQLNSQFPTSRSRTDLSAKNVQEQSDLERTLPNTLAPVSASTASPGQQLVVGFGRNLFLKKAVRISFIGFLQEESEVQTSAMKIQTLPDVAAIASGNNLVPVIRAQSSDQQYQRLNSTAAFLNSNLYFGRNKISFKAVFRSQLSDVFNKQSDVYKPDEDSLAHSGMVYQISQKQSLQTQLSGDHGLGIASRFKLHWIATYRHEREQNPDGRNVLLRQPTAGVDLYQLAQPATTTAAGNDLPLSYSSRDWRSVSEDVFTGQVDLGIPIHLFQMAARITGGVMIQTVNRELHDDLYLLSGSVTSSLGELFSSKQYYPGQLALSNYYENPSNVNVILASNRGNYTASRNVAAAFIKAAGQSAQHIRWSAGLRMESSSQLASSTQYSYFTGFKYPRNIPLDQNTVPTQILLLPSVSVSVPLATHLDLAGSYVRSVGRPELQELVNYRQYDPVSFSVQSGNSLLQNTLIDNYRVSATWVGKRDNQIGLTAFYKSFDNAIENEMGGFGTASGVVLFTPFNMPSAYIKGLSLSFRYRFAWPDRDVLLSYLTLFGEADWLSSSVSGGPLKSLTTPTTTAHPMTETPKQVYTAGLLLQHPRFPMLSLSMSHFTDYLSIVGSGQKFTVATDRTIEAMPGYRIKGRTNLDLQLSQLIFKGRLQVAGAVKNLLRPSFIEYQDLNGNGKFDGGLQLFNSIGSGGYYRSGTDNTVRAVKTQSSFVLSVSYLIDKR